MFKIWSSNRAKPSISHFQGLEKAQAPSMSKREWWWTSKVGFEGVEAPKLDGVKRVSRNAWKDLEEEHVKTFMT